MSKILLKNFGRNLKKIIFQLFQKIFFFSLKNKLLVQDATNIIQEYHPINS